MPANRPPSPPAAAGQHAVGAGQAMGHGVDERHGAVAPALVPVAGGQFDARAEVHALAVGEDAGVDRVDRAVRAQPHAVADEAGVGVDERLGHPVGDRRGELDLAFAGQQDRGGPVRGRVLDPAVQASSAPPPDTATAVFGPAAVQLAGDRPQHPAFPGQGARALDGEAEPGDVVVERVGPAAAVAEAHAAGERGDGGRAVGVRVTQLGVDQAVQQVRLPPVVPRERRRWASAGASGPGRSGCRAGHPRWAAGACARRPPRPPPHGRPSPHRRRARPTVCRRVRRSEVFEELGEPRQVQHTGVGRVDLLFLQRPRVGVGDEHGAQPRGAGREDVRAR